MNRKNFRRLISLLVCAVMLFSLAACGKKPAAATLDLNALTLDQIIEGAKKEGKLESVGMPGSWANWKDTWDGMKTDYGITCTDTDMSSGEEIAMFEAEKSAPTKDIGDVGHKFGPEAKAKGVTQSYKTTYWDSVPDWAKDPDGEWMIAYTGVTTF
ncbi:MAG: ABC transporter substrate-binding protein, partial [Angelakisella sp.]